MTQPELTARGRLATLPMLNGGVAGMKRTVWLTAGLGLPLALGGCITVNAPKEPIVIELNVNIRQEVIYRLAQDAGTTIEENKDIF